MNFRAFFFLQIVGPTLMALSLRVLFDPEFTHLFFQGGNYYVGHILVAIGALMTVTGILGCIGVLAENSCLLWMVNNYKKIQISLFQMIIINY